MISVVDDLVAAADTLKRGGILLYPTDTVWGIGCDARCSEAVRRIFDLKHRADSKAMITLVSDEEMLARHINGEVPHAVTEFILEHNSRPVTMVYPQGRDVAPELLGADGSIGMRLVYAGFPHRLCRMLGAPVVSTSANISGQPAAATFSEISPEMIAGVDYVCLTGRDSSPAQPSMVARLTPGGEIEILRG